MAEMDRAFVEPPVRVRYRFDERQQFSGRTRRGGGRELVDPGAQEQ